MQINAAMASTGCIEPGATTIPTSAVNTTRNITRGFISTTKSATSPPVAESSSVAIASTVISAMAYSLKARDRSASDPACGSGAKGPLRRFHLPLLPHLIRGNVSKVWNGGGDGTVHSSVVAPAPQGLAAARSLRAKL